MAITVIVGFWLLVVSGFIVGLCLGMVIVVVREMVKDIIRDGGFYEKGKHYKVMKDEVEK